MAVALVIFSRWNPLLCLAAALFFGALGSLGSSLQALGFSQGFHLFNAAPALFTLLIMVATSSRFKVLRGKPTELSVNS